VNSFQSKCSWSCLRSTSCPCRWEKRNYSSYAGRLAYFPYRVGCKFKNHTTLWRFFLRFILKYLIHFHRENTPYLMNFQGKTSC